MSESLKSHLWSAGITFAGTFLVTLGAAIKGINFNGLDITVSGSFAITLIITAGRTAIKALMEDLLKADVLLGVKK
jgi:hypothetical protein